MDNTEYSRLLVGRSLGRPVLPLLLCQFDCDSGVDPGLSHRRPPTTNGQCIDYIHHALARVGTSDFPYGLQRENLASFQFLLISLVVAS